MSRGIRIFAAATARAALGLVLLAASAARAVVDVEIGVHVERFYGQSSFENCRRTILEFKGGNLEVAGTRLTTPNPRLPSRLVSNDSFALKVMTERKTLNPEDTCQCHRASAGLQTDQVTNIEFVCKVAPADTKAALQIAGEKHDMKAEELYAGFSESYASPTSPRKLLENVRIASIRLISGQAPSRRPGAAPSEIAHYDLKWAAKFADVAKAKLDPNVHAFTWELGRAAQLAPELVHLNTRIAALVAARELDAMGGDINKAWVFVHAAKGRLVDLYKRYGFTEFAEPLPGQPNRVLIIPLKQLLDQSEVGDVFPSLGRLAKRSGQSPLEVLRHVDDAIEGRRLALEVSVPGSEGKWPLVLRDLGADDTSTPYGRGTKRRLANDLRLDEPDINWTFNLAAGNSRTPMREITITGMAPLARSGHFAASLIELLKNYRNRLRQRGLVDVDASLRQSSFAFYASDIQAIRSAMQETDLDVYEVWSKGDPTRHALIMDGSEVLKFEKNYRGAGPAVRAEPVNDRAQRVFKNPLNF